MPSELLEDLKELREAVNQSSQHTQRQLQSIEPTLLLVLFAFGC